MSGMNVSHVDSYASMGLISLQGETTRRRYELPRVTVRAQSPLNLTRRNIYRLDVVHTNTNSNATLYIR